MEPSQKEATSKLTQELTQALKEEREKAAKAEKELRAKAKEAATMRVDAEEAHGSLDVSYSWHRVYLTRDVQAQTALAKLQAAARSARRVRRCRIQAFLPLKESAVAVPRLPSAVTALAPMDRFFTQLLHHLRTRRASDGSRRRPRRVPSRSDQTTSSSRSRGSVGVGN